MKNYDPQGKDRAETWEVKLELKENYGTVFYIKDSFSQEMDFCQTDTCESLF